MAFRTRKAFRTFEKRGPGPKIISYSAEHAHFGKRSTAHSLVPKLEWKTPKCSDMNPPSVYLEVSIAHSFLVLFFFLDSYLKYDYAIFRREYVQFFKLSHKNVTDPLPTIPQVPGLKPTWCLSNQTSLSHSLYPEPLSC